MELIWCNKVLCVNKAESIVRQYIKGFSMSELAASYKVSTDTIKRLLKRNNIVIRTPAVARNLDRYNKKRNETVSYKFDSNVVSDIISRYTSGSGTIGIGKIYNVDASVIVRILKENGVSIRNIEQSKKYKDVTIAKFRETIVDRYGGWDEINKIQQRKSIEKYGVKNPMQRPEIFDRQQRSALKIKETIIDGIKISYQGYEDRALHQLISEGYNIKDIVIGDVTKIPVIEYFYYNKHRKYYPDIYIPRDNLIIEVKSIWTYEKEKTKNIAKQKACIKAGYNFKFLIF